MRKGCIIILLVCLLIDVAIGWGIVELFTALGLTVILAWFTIPVVLFLLPLLLLWAWT